METIENLTERLEALENQTRAVKRRLHCWRGIACGQTRRSECRVHWRACLTMAALVVYALTPHPAHAKTFHCGAGDVSCLIAAINEAMPIGRRKIRFA